MCVCPGLVAGIAGPAEGSGEFQSGLGNALGSVRMQPDLYADSSHVASKSAELPDSPPTLGS